MGLPTNFGGRGITSRTDPRYQPGGLQQTPVAPPPVDPMPRSGTQPVGAPAPVAGPGGVSTVRGPAARPTAPNGMRRGAGVTGFTTRRASTPPWLQRAVPSGALIGG